MGLDNASSDGSLTTAETIGGCFEVASLRISSRKRLAAASASDLPPGGGARGGGAVANPAATNMTMASRLAVPNLGSVGGGLGGRGG